MDLSNRELASLILLAAFFAWTLTKRDIRASMGRLLRVSLGREIATVVVAYLIYAAAAVALGQAVGAWDFRLLKDSVIVVFVVGFPLLINAPNLATGKVLVREVVHKTLGAAALVAVFLNVVSLPLWGELMTLPIIAVLVMIGQVAATREETRAAAGLANALLSVAGIALLAFTAHGIAVEWAHLDHATIGRSALMSVWLPFLLVPFIYTAAFWMHVESTLVRLKVRTKTRRLGFRVRLGFVFGLHGSAYWARTVASDSPRDLVDARGFWDALRTMREYRRSAQTEIARSDELQRNLAANADPVGVDEHGMRADRREFAATKKILLWLYTCQQGWHLRQLKHYQADITRMVGDGTRFGLPHEHGVELRVSKDKQAWYGWRQTVGGWCFGIGGSADVLCEWQYSGSTPPSEFPQEHSGEWIDAARGDTWPEWSRPED